jgi:hypothetical protein
MTRQEKDLIALAAKSSAQLQERWCASGNDTPPKVAAFLRSNAGETAAADIALMKSSDVLAKAVAPGSNNCHNIDCCK